MSLFAGMATAGVAANLASRLISAAHRGVKSAGAEPPNESFGMHMLRQLDKDGDGALNVQEFGGLADVFARLDSNKDGVLVAGELETGLARAQASGRAHANAGRLIQHFDVDRNGLLTKTEWDAGDALFDKLDIDGDGQIGAGEIARGYLRHRESFEEYEGI